MDGRNIDLIVTMENVNDNAHQKGLQEGRTFLNMWKKVG